MFAVKCCLLYNGIVLKFNNTILELVINSKSNIYSVYV